MQDEKYVNYYIETLTATMTDCVVRNVSMQANAKLKDDIIKQQADKIGEFAKVNEELFNELEELKRKSAASESTKVVELNVELAKKGNIISEMNANHQTALKKLNEDIRVLNGIKTQYETLKSQAGNADVFRNQLIKEREAHQATKSNFEQQILELTSRIESLQNPPKKKRTKTPVDIVALAEQQQETVPENTVKDGGSF